MKTSLIAKAGGGTAALSAVSVGVTYEATKGTIGDYLKNTSLQENSPQEEWNRAERKFKKLTKNNNWLEEFKNLHDELNGANTKKLTLKKTCLSLYEKFYGSAFKRDEELATKTKEHCSQAEEIIWDRVKNFVFPEGFNEEAAWKKAQDKLKTESTKVNELVEPFNDLRAKLQSNGEHASETKGMPLKKTCLEVYEKKMDTTKETKTRKLIEQTRAYCVVAIKDMFENGKTFDKTNNSDDSTLQTKMQALNVDTVKDNEDLKQKFTEWKDTPTDTNKKTAFRNWCNNLYEKLYLGSEDKNWKLADTNCKK